MHVKYQNEPKGDPMLYRGNTLVDTAGTPHLMHGGYLAHVEGHEDQRVWVHGDREPLLEVIAGLVHIGARDVAVKLMHDPEAVLVLDYCVAYCRPHRPPKPGQAEVDIRRAALDRIHDMTLVLKQLRDDVCGLAEVAHEQRGQAEDARARIDQSGERKAIETP